LLPSPSRRDGAQLAAVAEQEQRFLGLEVRGDVQEARSCAAAGTHQAAQDLWREPGIEVALPGNEVALPGNDAFAGAAGPGLLVANDATHLA